MHFVKVVISLKTRNHGDFAEDCGFSFILAMARLLMPLMMLDAGL